MSLASSWSLAKPCPRSTKRQRQQPWRMMPFPQQRRRTQRRDADERPGEVRSSPAARRLAKELGVDITQVQGSGRGGRISEKDVQTFHDEQSRIAATPLARRMAEEEDLDLAQIQGTGPDGRITEDDVLRVLEGQGPP